MDTKFPVYDRLIGMILEADTNLPNLDALLSTDSENISPAASPEMDSQAVSQWQSQLATDNPAEVQSGADKFIDNAQLVLAFVGFMRNWMGPAADILNALIYMARGDYLSMWISFLAAAPGMGELAQGGKLLIRLFRAGDIDLKILRGLSPRNLKSVFRALDELSDAANMEARLGGGLKTIAELTYNAVQKAYKQPQTARLFDNLLHTAFGTRLRTIMNRLGKSDILKLTVEDWYTVFIIMFNKAGKWGVVKPFKQAVDQLSAFANKVISAIQRDKVLGPIWVKTFPTASRSITSRLGGFLSGSVAALGPAAAYSLMNKHGPARVVQRQQTNPNAPPERVTSP